MPNFVEVQPPGSGRLFVVLRVITSGDRIPFTPLDYVPLDLVHSPDCGFGEEVAGGTRLWFNLRGQLLNRPEDRLIEFIRSSSIYPPVEGFADVSAG